MDEEFGISSLVDKEMKVTAPKYTSRDLKGLKVAHDQAKFQEGVTTILTLADKGESTEGYYNVLQRYDMYSCLSFDVLTIWTMPRKSGIKLEFWVMGGTI